MLIDSEIGRRFVFLASFSVGCGGTATETQNEETNSAGEPMSSPEGPGMPSPHDQVGSVDGSDEPQDSTAYDTCPSAPPVNGSSCSENGIACTYGDSLRLDCRTQAECFDNEWSVYDGSSCVQPPQATCPASPPDEGSACESIDSQGNLSTGDSAISCIYDTNTFCVCRECPDGFCDDGPGWECLPPPADDRCPSVSPNLGETCDVAGLSCEYGDPCLDDGSSRFCRNGYWHQGSFSCDF